MNTLINETTSEININKLDESVSKFNNGDAASQKLLVEFAAHGKASIFALQILKSSRQIQTQSYALVILLNSIKSRWQLFRDEDKINIRNFVIKLLLQLLHSPKNDHLQLVTMINNIIVEIAKKQWPSQWPEFIPEMLLACKKSDEICANNLHLLEMLVEEIFESENSVTTKQKSLMKPEMEKGFPDMFMLCLIVLENSKDKIPLMKSTLKALNRFIPWMPKKFVFESQLVKILVIDLFQIEALRNNTMECLCSIASIATKNEPENYFAMICKMFKFVVSKTSHFLLEEFDFNKNYNESHNDFRNHVLFLANFFVALLNNYIQRFDKVPELATELQQSYLLLLKMTSIEEAEIFKICLEHWQRLTTDLVALKRRIDSPITLGRMQNLDENRLDRYKQILSRLRTALISRMERPREVAIIEDDNGDIVKEEIEESYNKETYELMRNCLVNCAELDSADTTKLILAALAPQIDKKDLDVKRLNRLSWAAGSISGSMAPDAEKVFLVHIIRDLLQMCDQSRAKAQKAVIASCIMYIVGQFPRFLRQHWNFLKTVVNKLFEFMHESFPGVKEMAVETFLSIVTKCAADFVKAQEGQFVQTPFVYEILVNMEDFMADLDSAEEERFYEAIAIINSAQSNPDMREKLVTRMMETPNKVWREAVSVVKTDLNMDKLSQISKVLRINIKVAKGLGSFFELQLSVINIDMLDLYKFLTDHISNFAKEKGEMIFQDGKTRIIMTIRSEILTLFRIHIGNIKENNKNIITEKFIPALYEPLLDQFMNIHPLVRDHHVVSLFEVLIEKTGTEAKSLLPQIFSTLIKNTAEMVETRKSEFSEHGVKLYRLLKAIFVHCFPVILSLNESDFMYLYTRVINGVDHRSGEISRLGLEIVKIIIEKVEYSGAFNQFYKSNLVYLITVAMSVMSDTLHKGGYDLQTEILAKLIAVVKKGDITEPIYQPNSKFNSNRGYVRESLLNFISEKFKGHLTMEETKSFVDELFDHCESISEFRNSVDDFLLTVKEFKSCNGFI